MRQEDIPCCQVSPGSVVQRNVVMRFCDTNGEVDKPAQKGAAWNYRFACEVKQLNEGLQVFQRGGPTARHIANSGPTLLQLVPRQSKLHKNGIKFDSRKYQALHRTHCFLIGCRNAHLFARLNKRVYNPATFGLRFSPKQKIIQYMGGFWGPQLMPCCPFERRAEGFKIFYRN